MTSSPRTGAPPASPPRWGLADAAAGWVVALVSSALLGGLLLQATGHGETDPDDLPLAVVALLQVTLWVGLAGAPVVATRRRGGGLVRDLGLRFRAVDVPIGVAVGLASQLLLVPLVSWPWLQLLGRDPDDLKEDARQLTERATDAPSVVLLVAIVVVGAPLVEELFYRGLLQRSLRRHLAPVLSVLLSGLAFGLAHLQLLQLPALVAFGWVLGTLAQRSGRLGPAIVAHLVFNLTTVVLLLEWPAP